MLIANQNNANSRNKSIIMSSVVIKTVPPLLNLYPDTEITIGGLQFECSPEIISFPRHSAALAPASHPYHNLRRY